MSRPHSSSNSGSCVATAFRSAAASNAASGSRNARWEAGLARKRWSSRPGSGNQGLSAPEVELEAHRLLGAERTQGQDATHEADLGRAAISRGSRHRGMPGSSAFPLAEPPQPAIPGPGEKEPFLCCCSGLVLVWLMPQSPLSRERVTLDLKLGRWLEARATGWAVLTVPILVALVVLAAVFGLAPR